MKRLMAFLVLLMAQAFVGTAVAQVEVVLLQPSICVRTESAPSICTFTFPGISGRGTLTVENGDSTGRYRVSSATVRLNGKIVIDPESFNQTVSSLVAPVDLGARNTLAVEMRGAPGGQLGIRVTEPIDGEVGAVVGPAGGTVSIVEPNSPLAGVTLSFPPGAFSENTIITIGRASSPAVPLPNPALPDGPALFLWSSTPLRRAALLDMPVAQRTDDSQLSLFFYFDDTLEEWSIVAPVPSASPGHLAVMLDHFSIYQKGTATVTSSIIDSGFSLQRDTPSVDNGRYACTYATGAVEENGICVGMSVLARAYFNEYAEKYGEGLSCRYKPETAYRLACQIHGVYAGESGSWLEARETLADLALFQQLVNPDFGLFVDYLKWELTAGRPVSVATFPAWQPGKGHNVLVIRWRSTGLFSGAFQVYDNQNRFAAPLEITYWRASLITNMSYTDFNGTDYDWIADQPRFGVGSYIESTPRDGTCPPDVEFLDQSYVPATIPACDPWGGIPCDGVPMGFSYDFAQTFTVSRAGTVNAVEILLRGPHVAPRWPGGLPFYVLRTTTSGVPIFSPSSWVDVLPDQLPGVDEVKWLRVDVSSLKITAAAGEKLAIYPVYGEGSSTSEIIWLGSDPGYYSRGAIWGGYMQVGNWRPYPGDLYFRVYLR